MFIWDALNLPEYRNAGKKVIPASLVLPLVCPWQSGIGIPASTSVRYRWSRTGQVVPTYEYACSVIDTTTCTVHAGSLTPHAQ
jgi:hypothetical protein